MKKTRINLCFVDHFLDPLCGCADDDEEVKPYRNLDPNDEEGVKRVIRNLIRPYILRFDRESLAQAKLALRYALTSADTRFDRIYYSVLPPFSPPAEPRSFFTWIWEVCFSGEDFTLDDMESYHVKNNLDEPRRSIRLAPEET